MKGITEICFKLTVILLIIFCASIGLKNNYNSTNYLVSTTSEKQDFNQLEQDAPNSKTKVFDYKYKQPEQSGSQDRIFGFAESTPPPKDHHTRSLSNDLKKKGFDFEKYVVKKFNNKNYKLQDWAGNKYVKENYVETTQQPDLIYEFQRGEVRAGFAMECKWRSKLCHNEIEIASYQQIKNYKAFEKKSGFPVFITLGVGGEPMAPKQLYIIPLIKIFSNKLDQSFLMEFEQVPSRNFYYDYTLQSLSARSKQPVAGQS